MCKNLESQDSSNSQMNTYYIHDNGGRPFKVVINKGFVRIYRMVEINDTDEDENEHENKYENFPILIFESQKNSIYIGKSPMIEMTKFRCSYGPEFDGNSILVHLGDNTYVYIGDRIFSFKSLAPIVNFVSPVGNSDVPYPYAIDSSENIYLLIEGIVIKKNTNTEKQIKEYDNPYAYYYDHSLITSDKGRIIPKQPKIKNFQNIKKYFIGEEQYTLRYQVDPEKDYDRVIPLLGNKMYISDTSDNKIELTKSKYIELMESFGIHKSYEKIKDKVIHHKRLW